MLKTSIHELRTIILKSAHIYSTVLKQTFVAMFLMLLIQQLLRLPAFSATSMAFGFLTMVVEFVGSIVFMAYLMSLIATVINQRKINNKTHIQDVIERLPALLGAAFLQALVIFGCSLFWAMLLMGAGSFTHLEAGEFIGGWTLVFMLAGLFPIYLLICLMQPIVLFQKISVWQSLLMSARWIKQQWLLAACILVLEVSLWLISTVFVWKVTEGLGIESFGFQIVLDIFVFTLILPFVQTMMMYLYFHLKNSVGT